MLEYLRKLIEIFLHGRISTSPPVTYVFSTLYECGLIDIYILRYKPTLFYLICLSNYSSFDHWELFQLAPVSL